MSVASSGPRVTVLADDLIWSTRLLAHVRATGADVTHVRDARAFDRALGRSDAVIVDLTARAYDGVKALEAATGAGVPALAVGQHDDRDLRRRALEAGATKVYAYRRLFEAGPRTLEGWLAGIGVGRRP